MDEYFAMLVLNDNEILHYRTLDRALEEMASRGQGIVVIYHLHPDGEIREDESQCWTWRDRIVHNRYVMHRTAA